MKTNTAKTEGKDPILENKDIFVLEAILNHDTLNHHTRDSNLITEIVTTRHTETHIKVKKTADLVAIPTPKAPAEVNPIQRTEKDPIHSIDLGHHL